MPVISRLGFLTTGREVDESTSFFISSPEGCDEAICEAIRTGVTESVRKCPVLPQLVASHSTFP